MISLWECWALPHLRGGQTNIWWFEAFYLPFSGTKGPPKGPRGSPMVLNWQTSVAWKVETKYSTMGQFHYGNTERYYLRDGQRDIWWFEVFCLPFSGTKGPPKGPPGSQTVLNGQTSVPWEVEIKYSTMGWFLYGNTECYSFERWTKEYLMIWGIFFAVFRL